MLVRRHISIVVVLLLCQVFLIRCGSSDRAAPAISVSTPAYPALVAAIYPAPTGLPSYPARTSLPVPAVTVFVDLPSPRLGIVYDHALQIIAVEANSPAAHAMLQAGDRIRKVNDQAVTTPEAFRQVVDPLLTSATFTITVERSGSILLGLTQLRACAPTWPAQSRVTVSLDQLGTAEWPDE